MKKTVTIGDIARLYKKDKSTVSRALRNDDRVKPETRKKIQQLARELGYRPNIIARSLMAGKTQTILLIVPILNVIEREIAINTTRYLNAQNYDLAIMLFHRDENIHGRLLEKLEQKMADGAIVMPYSSEAHAKIYEELLAKDVPVVFLDRNVNNVKTTTITTDNTRACMELVERCYSAGVRDFIILFNDKNIVEQSRKQATHDYIETLRDTRIINSKHINNLESHKVAILSSLQKTINEFVTQTPELASAEKIVFGVFDEWHGEPYPAQEAYVCIQDFDRMATLASQKVIDMVRNGVTNIKEKIEIPPASLVSIKPFCKGLQYGRNDHSDTL